jgi:hypothetical protein
VKELRVMSREEILPTYKTPALVAHRKVKWAVTGSNRRPLRCNPLSTARR